VTLVAVVEPDLRAREHPFDRAAAARVDRVDDMKDLHTITLSGARLGRDNRLAIACKETNHKLYFASHIA
jgi:hypothetical protein